MLLFGAMGLAWRRFLPLVVLGNVLVALGYALLGSIGSAYFALPATLAASVAIPVLFTALVRKRLRRSEQEESSMPSHRPRNR